MINRRVNPRTASKALVQQMEIKKNGVVYTPTSLAQYAGEKVAEYFLDSTLQELATTAGRDSIADRLMKTRILDPACGDGELLVSVWNALLQRLVHKAAQQDRLLALDPTPILCGTDIDPKAVQNARMKIASLIHSPSMEPAPKIITTNALFPFGQDSSASGWAIMKSRFAAVDGFDIVIANPPWGADVESYKHNLSKGEFSLYRGQFDTADLFMELAIHILKPGGHLAFIVPDSLFAIERSALRSMLLTQTEIRYIGRFGERIFENINRACAVVICRKVKPSASAVVDCLRLTPELRRGILSGEVTFNDAEGLLSHRVPQDRFRNNADHRFDIDIREDDQMALEAIKNPGSTIRDYLFSGRGIELSKSGKVCRCHACNSWLPYPTSRTPKCPHCKSPISLDRVKPENIVSKRPDDGYERIIVGESVRRYELGPPCWIATGRAGINYKDRNLYKGPKLLVRKTGVGLSASIDYEDSYTNQVVYILKPKPGCTVPLEFFLALLSSRAMYYYLVKTHGETEWRSHPYLAQKHILDLPLPRVDLGKGHGLRTVTDIVALLRRHLPLGEPLPPAVDARIEYFVSQLFGLSRRQYERIYATLGEVQELLPVRRLKSISIADIFYS